MPAVKDLLMGGRVKSAMAVVCFNSDKTIISASLLHHIKEGSHLSA